MKPHLLKLELLTNLHVGDEGGMGLVENSVQRDSVLKDMPIIPGSGVKGALREYFEDRLTDGQKKREIFGYPVKKDEKGEVQEPSGDGKYKFFDAFCLARPLRVSEGHTPYVLATSTAIVVHTLKLLHGIGFGPLCQMDAQSFATLIGNIDSLSNSLDDAAPFLVRTDSPQKIATIEGYAVRPTMGDGPVQRCVSQLLDALIGKTAWAIAKNLNDYDLPVRARNCLDDDKRNLWYEEYVPHKSVFLAPLLTPDNDADKPLPFGEPVQFGANGSVGMGYASVSFVDLSPNGALGGQG
ncbi:MAG TPA: hypothetical protein DEB25_06085 [Desulfobulbaceae bacterium]|nr:hypothetical protein [Desulfobulbaceae bacterium]